MCIDMLNQTTAVQVPLRTKWTIECGPIRTSTDPEERLNELIYSTLEIIL